MRPCKDMTVEGCAGCATTVKQIRAGQAERLKLTQPRREKPTATRDALVDALKAKR